MNRNVPLVEFQGIQRLYGEGEGLVRALAGVDLHIFPSEFVAIMGPSGSGKSTAMNIIGCLDRPTHGRYLFNGVDVTGLGHDQLALLRRTYLGFVFQGYNLLARTTAVENVELPLVYRGMAREERRERSIAALRQVGLAGREDHTPAQLSGGQQQRVAIARAIVSDPLLLLADEPTGNLDSARSQEIMELLTHLNTANGLTVVMVTHEPDMAAYAGRNIHFLDGRIESDSLKRAA
ncbi:ABC transporter ATP-binding protein [Aestuariivirga sp.]|uniref:ABC transporter ATP-binding protein n=1 Tax=Aestuariivirga sp. TaxID=2650926 RepID=UPI0039E3B881